MNPDVYFCKWQHSMNSLSWTPFQLDCIMLSPWWSFLGLIKRPKAVVFHCLRQSQTLHSTEIKYLSRFCMITRLAYLLWVSCLLNAPCIVIALIHALLIFGFFITRSKLLVMLLLCIACVLMHSINAYKALAMVVLDSLAQSFLALLMPHCCRTRRNTPVA